MGPCSCEWNVIARRNKLPACATCIKIKIIAFYYTFKLFAQMLICITCPCSVLWQAPERLVVCLSCISQLQTNSQLHQSACVYVYSFICFSISGIVVDFLDFLHFIVIRFPFSLPYQLCCCTANQGVKFSCSPALLLTCSTPLLLFSSVSTPSPFYSTLCVRFRKFCTQTMLMAA